MFGLACGALVWLLAHRPVSLAATYAYVNPDVAVVVGWALLDEAITPTIIAGAAIILASVAFVLRQEAA